MTGFLPPAKEPVLCGFDSHGPEWNDINRHHRETQTEETKSSGPAPQPRTTGIGRKSRVGSTGSQPFLYGFDSCNPAWTGLTHHHGEVRTEETKPERPAPPPGTVGDRRKIRVGSVGSGSGQTNRFWLVEKKKERKEKLKRANWVVCNKKWGRGVCIVIQGVLIAGAYKISIIR